ncbi:SDR family oxidoreductase [Niabella ginsengisoli]|nr:SDR family oxidoreductase [Niabella ginsengisoli]
MLLENKIIFLTGGSTGIGQHCAMAYAKEGAKVVVFALNEMEINETLKK